ncbi:MAG: hypothetical protein DIU63_13150 [Proteobacteria bacterium]|jgi:hypothetical protein|nr:MAG: hypothetical protein DIU63_13150 [Pseudomonadota bacterium]
MGKVWIAGMRAAGLGLGALMLMVSSAGAQDLSERAVKAFMDYAWALTPAKFTKPDGTSVEIDKKDRGKVEIPMDVAREVIKVGRLTAHAQICELPEDQVENYRSLMRRETAKNKWTEQQLIYINQLHLTTVMLLTGKIRLVEKRDGEKDVVIEEPDKNDAKTCTDEQRKKVKELIAAYIATEPKPDQPKAAQAPAPVKK